MEVGATRFSSSILAVVIQSDASLFKKHSVQMCVPTRDIGYISAHCLDRWVSWRDQSTDYLSL